MIVEIIREDTVKVYGATPEDARWNAAQFQREFIAERFRDFKGCHAGLANSNGKEYFCEIIFRPRWRRARDEEVHLLVGQHLNSNNVAFVRLLRQLVWDKVLIGEVVVRKFWGNKEEVLCQNCYIQNVSSYLSRDDDDGDRGVSFVTNDGPQKTVHCSVSQIVSIVVKSSTSSDVQVTSNYFAETNLMDTIKISGEIADEVEKNAMHFRREFVGKRWRKIETVNSTVYTRKITFRERWRRDDDLDITALRGQHSNRENAAFLVFLRRLKEEAILIDRVVLRQSDGEVLCQKCYIADIRLSKDRDAAQGIIMFNPKRYFIQRDPAIPECLVNQIDHIWI